MSVATAQTVVTAPKYAVLLVLPNVLYSPGTNKSIPPVLSQGYQKAFFTLEEQTLL